MLSKQRLDLSRSGALPSQLREAMGSVNSIRARFQELSDEARIVESFRDPNIDASVIVLYRFQKWGIAVLSLLHDVFNRDSVYCAEFERYIGIAAHSDLSYISRNHYNQCLAIFEAAKDSYEKEFSSRIVEQKKKSDPRKNRIRELLEEIRKFRMCGPSDDPDEITSITQSMRYLAIQIRQTATPLLPESLVTQISRIDVKINDLDSAYNAKAELDALSFDIELILNATSEDQMPANEIISPDKKKVFIIHGRNNNARVAIEHFVKSLGLVPIDFDELAADLGGFAFVGDIVRAGLRQAQGIIALFTPDEFATLRTEYHGKHDKAEAIERWQARPNVIFEAGMAYGMAPERTLLVTLGTDVALFSDVDGVHIVRLNNQVSSRSKLRQKLIGVKCEVNQRSDAWTDLDKSGDFENCLPVP